MYGVILIKEIFAVVIHGEGRFVDPRESESRVFVCGSLMDPAFVAGLLGHEIAMTPAAANGFSRGWGESTGKKFHFLQRDATGMVSGMALLGLSAADISRLEEFEQAPAVRQRADIEMIIGDISLAGHTYLKKI
ncbi:MAG: gamma-glutamylcyclotransferase family protein [bacterium]